MEIDTLTYANSLELKVSELLKEARLEYSPAITAFVDDVVSSVTEAINGVPDDFQVTSGLAPNFVKDIGADKVEFRFKKPKTISVGGSYSIRSAEKHVANVDLLVGLPKECFHEKDYLNHRYHAKRCLYLCVIKKHLILSSRIEKVEWSTLQNEARKPILVAYPAKMPLKVPGISLRIIPVATSLFDVAKLNLKRNNVRAASKDGVSQPTPKYNSSILEDMFLEDNTEFVQKSFAGWKELSDALVLLKIWARKRSSIYAHDCLNGYLLSVILTYLATQDKINRSLKAIEIFRVALDFIAASKLWERGLYFPPQGLNPISKEQKIQFRQLFPVLICDSSSHVNLAFRMTSVGFEELQEEASLSLKSMEKAKDGGFEESFMTKIDHPIKYDHCIRLNFKGTNKFYAPGFCLDDECWRVYELKVQNLLQTGLGDRAKRIRVTWRNTSEGWHIENGLAEFDREPLFIGISISSTEKAFRLVDIGPNAENKDEARKFREFWGEKAELRRFKDGRIAESTVWETQPWTKHLILKQIVEHVVVRHLLLPKENIMQIVDQFDFSLICGDKDLISLSGTLLGAFEVLSKCLHQIDDIPLKVSSVQALDSAFRFTSVFPPERHPLADEKVDKRALHTLMPSCIPAMEVMIQLEGSGNWPMDDLAIEKTKSAFLLRVAESLQGNGIPCTASEKDVDVFMGGYAFRLRILHERGLGLLKRETEADPVKKVSTTDKILFLRSQHASMINGLQGRYPVYAPVVRLAKRWVASHLFSACLAEEAVELLVAYFFLKPLPLGVPCSRVNGLLRFLRLLADWDWMFLPLIVDINNDFSRNDEKEINDNFMSSRKAYEEDKQNISSTMFLATSYDRASEAWTRSSPNGSELKRLVAYARSSANMLTRLIMQESNDSFRWEGLFRTPLSTYDAVILLHRHRLPFPQRLLFPSELSQGKHVARGKASASFNPFFSPLDIKRKNQDELQNKLLVNFDPLKCLVADLKNNFTGFKLWYDHLGGDAVGLTWEKPISEKRERDEGVEEEKQPIDVLRAIGGTGKGFVRDVYLLKKPRLL